MAEECSECGASFAGPADLIGHVKRAHSPTQTNAPETPKHLLACALCGQRFPSREALAAHNLRPHYRGNRPVPGTPTYG